MKTRRAARARCCSEQTRVALPIPRGRVSKLLARARQTAYRIARARLHPKQRRRFSQQQPWGRVHEAYAFVRNRSSRHLGINAVISSRSRESSSIGEHFPRISPPLRLYRPVVLVERFGDSVALSLSGREASSVDNRLAQLAISIIRDSCRSRVN